MEKTRTETYESNLKDVGSAAAQPVDSRVESGEKVPNTDNLHTKDSETRHVETEKGMTDESSRSDEHSAIESLTQKNKEITEMVTEEVGPPPDGGWLAWMQVLGGFFCNFSSWGIVNTFGDFQTYYRQELLSDSSEMKISWIGALSACLVLCGANFFGFLVDRGYHTWLVLIAGIVQCFSMMMLSLSTQYYQVMLTQGLLNGLAAGAMFIVGLSAVAPYFSKKRALAIGIATAGSAVGGTVYSAVVIQLLPKIGFPWTVRILGFMALATCAIVTATIRKRLPPRKRGTILAFECLKEPVFMFYALGCVCSFCALYNFYFYIDSYARSLHPDTNSLIYTVSIVNAGSLVGRILPNYLSPRVGAFNCLIFTSISSAIVAFCWIPATSTGGIIAVSLIYGAVSGPIMGLPGAIISELTPNLNRLGVRLAFSFLFNGVGVLLGGPMAGIMVRKHSYNWAKVFCGICWLLALVFNVIAKWIHSKGDIFGAY